MKGVIMATVLGTSLALGANVYAKNKIHMV